MYHKYARVNTALNFIINNNTLSIALVLRYHGYVNTLSPQSSGRDEFSSRISARIIHQQLFGRSIYLEARCSCVTSSRPAPHRIGECIQFRQNCSIRWQLH